MPRISNTPEHNCPVCAESGMEPFFSVDLAPVFCCVLWDNSEQALSAAQGPVNLAFCGQCGFIYNLAFDQSLVEYSAAYENSLDFSPRFQEYSQALAQRLTERYELYNKNIIEIGCGQGDFLRKLQRLGNNHAIGFDPAHDPAQKNREQHDTRLRVVRERYSTVHGQYPADFICCRHVLEHIPDPLDFIRILRRTIGEKEKCVIYIEVPNSLYTLKHMGIWDIIYEHCSYFILESLVNLLIRADFEPVSVSEEYGGQYLAVEARPAPIGSCSRSKYRSIPDEISDMTVKFAEAYRAKADSWRRQLGKFRDQGDRVVLWGAGSKGVSFLNALNISSEHIPHIVDLNPHKHGKFVACTGQKVVAPDFLREYQPQYILVMNPIYRDEIKLMAHELVLKSEILCV